MGGLRVAMKGLTHDETTLTRIFTKGIRIYNRIIIKKMKRINKYAIGINASDTVINMLGNKERVIDSLRDRVREIKRARKTKIKYVNQFLN